MKLEKWKMRHSLEKLGRDFFGYFLVVEFHLSWAKMRITLLF